MDPQMSDLFKWSIENSETSQPPSSSAPQPPKSRPVNADALESLFGGPSDADLMKQSMAAILSPDITLENKAIAFDNFEQLIENIDNANNLDPMGLWAPLVELFGSGEAELRRMAAWCMGTAVQNNVKAQKKVRDPPSSQSVRFDDAVIVLMCMDHSCLTSTQSPSLPV